MKDELFNMTRAWDKENICTTLQQSNYLIFWVKLFLMFPSDVIDTPEIIIVIAIKILMMIMIMAMIMLMILLMTVSIRVKWPTRPDLILVSVAWSDYRYFYSPPPPPPPPPLDGSWSISWLPPGLSSLVSIYTPGWREALQEESVLPKNATQCPWQSLNLAAWSRDKWTSHHPTVPPTMLMILIMLTLIMLMIMTITKITKTKTLGV